MNRYKALTLQNKKVIHVTLLRSYKRVQHLLWPRRQCLHSQHSGEPNKDKRARNSFHFRKLVLQILFQIQFGLSYQHEICHRNERDFINSFNYIFSPKPVTMATIQDPYLRMRGVFQVRSIESTRAEQSAK